MSRRVSIAVVLFAAVVAVWLLRGRSAVPVDDADRPSVAARDGAMRPDGDKLSGSGEPRKPGSMRDRSGGPKKLKLASKPLPGQRREMADADVTPVHLEEDEVEKLVQTATEDPDPSQRAAAVTDLSLLDDITPALPVFRKAAHDKDEDVRLAVVISISRFGDQAPVDLLTEFSQDSDPEMRMEALGVIDSLLDEEALTADLRRLVEIMTRDHDEDVRDQAQDILDQLDGVSDADDVEPGEESELEQ